MQETSGYDPNYVMGRSTAETDRLKRQSQLYDSSTWQLLKEAGLAPGMKVLDVGSGAGNVSFIAASLVGKSGTVVGVDSNPAIVDEAAATARSLGLSQVSFRVGDIGTIELERDFDAVVGRLVLIYVKDPAALVRQLLAHVKPGGIVAFQDLDWGEGPIANPPSPLLSQAWGYVKEMFHRAGLNKRMGLSLHGTFVAAGLPAPRMSLFAPVGGGIDFDGYDYMASGLRSNQPHIVKLGVATEAELALDSFAERLRTEVVGMQGVFALPTFVGAWSRKQAA
ncbi:class I SAM-dependent methyltransferase [Bradyrhizobium sp. CER78]|uniref:class I SAM-dependent methyltransferase n=1 Tax=Bradyrhizobium sp. CER78 TaxID=3039162 RepID=UPI00244A2CB1|nr:class I SAM-dependent methyltransferase [Bradyrhizobium sp. CER78]MDH2384032.1 class I SAM-dependent methyltransferase [Bradyrhizobium sp. CER78]